LSWIEESFAAAEATGLVIGQGVGKRLTVNRSLFHLLSRKNCEPADIELVAR